MVKETGDTLVFEYLDGEEMDPHKDMHIHGLALEFNSSNEIVQRWQGYEGGKPTHRTVLTLRRVPTPPTP